MKNQMYIFLLLLIGICFLSVYSCMAAADSAMAVVQMTDTTSHTYRFSKSHITAVDISIPNAQITFHPQPHQEEIVVQVTGGTIQGAEEEKSIFLHSDAQQKYLVDIYLPERFYHVEIRGETLGVQTVDTMRGTMKIQADALEAELHDYCGSIAFVAKKGSVTIEKGNLQQASTVALLEQGNIYLHTKITDYAGISSFCTNQGAVKVQTDTLESDTFFEVSAIAVSGEYLPLSIQEKSQETCRKAQIIAENGIVYFEN